MKKYKQVEITITAEKTDLIIAELSSYPYDSFMETDAGLNAYIEDTEFDEALIKTLQEKYGFQYKVETMAQTNWNEEWEKNFEPVYILDQCMVRASFHDRDKKYPYDIIINPKMSFGTGHHQTTSLMIENQLAFDHQGKIVMDAGSGTGILAIFAEKLKAKSVEAFDIEDWAFENMQENINLNNCGLVKAYQGDIKSVPLSFQYYDIILANINKNVLLAEMAEYSKRLQKGGVLILSGFYRQDVEDISQKAKGNQLFEKRTKEKDNWVSMVFEKR